MKMDSLLKTATTADLYDLLAATLNVIADRGDSVELLSGEIEADYAHVRRDELGEFIVVYYDESCAEDALLERDPREAGA